MALPLRSALVASGNVAYIARMYPTRCIIQSIFRAVILSLLPVTIIRAEAPREHPNIGLGRFTVRMLSLQSMLRPGHAANSLYAIREGDVRVTAGISYANIWNREPDVYLVDGEWAFIDLRVSYAFRHNMEAGFYAPMSVRHGGFLDNYIEDFHDALGLQQQKRTQYPRNKSRIERYEDGKTVYSQYGSSAGINDIPLFLAWHLSRGDEHRPAVIIQPKLTIPVGDSDQLEGLDKPTFGLGLILAKRIADSRHFAFAEFDVSYNRQNQIEGLNLRRTIYSGTAGWEYRWSSRTSLLAQYNIMSGVARDYKEWSEDAHHLNIGFKRQLSTSLILEASMQENLFHYNNSADVGFHIALTALF